VSLPAHLAASGTTDGAEVRVVLQRIAEPVQVDVDLLARFAEAGVFPRQTLVVAVNDGAVTGSGDGADTVLDLPDDVARHLFVTAD
ncbi:dihydrofolate reductase, partial [Streptomyces sp. SID13726]|nr:dihydrofolate reductase [Streptomyces sp. SID13726]